MMGIVAAIVGLLDKLLWILMAQRRLTAAERAQRERNDLENNPSSWFARHFAGGLPPTDQTNNPDQTDA